MNPRLTALAALISAAAAVTDGAAAGKDSYPSLAIRPAERPSGTIQPAPPAPEPAPPPISGQTLDEIAQLRAAAADADRRFQAAAQAAQRPVTAAHGAAPGSEAWAVAQVALSEAEARHNEAVAALGRLDQIHVEAQTEGASLTEIEAAVGEVAAQVQAQDAAIDGLEAGLGG